MPSRVALLVFLACSASLLGDNVDAILKEWDKPDTPGASVAVIRDGKLIFSKGYGLANLEYAIPITPDTVFHVASVSKQFTAMALVVLDQRGKLSLDDDIRKYLPELPDYGRRITIRHLLQHTGGIRDQWQTLAIAGWRLDDVITQKQILRVLFRQKELNFPPGSENMYSNGGYTLAAEIVARVAGKPFPEFCREAIFEPLGMKSTHFHDDHTHVDRNRAYSYGGGAGRWTASPLNYANAGATSLFTTAPDLALWLDNFRTSKVGNPAKLQEQTVLNDGRTIDYALGVVVSKFRGLKTISHGGGDAGYRTFVEFYPSENLGVVVLSNLGSFSPDGIAKRVAAAFLGEKLEAENKPASEPEPTYILVDSATRTKHEGVYAVDGGMVLQVTKGGDQLSAGPVGASPREIRATAQDRFWDPKASLELHFRESGDLVMTQRGFTRNGRRLAGPRPEAKDLPAFAGAYWNAELEAQYTVTVREGRLRFEHVRHGEFFYQPAAKDFFVGGQWFMPTVEFTRDASGQVTGFLATGGRVRGVQFTRR